MVATRPHKAVCVSDTTYQRIKIAANLRGETMKDFLDVILNPLLPSLKEEEKQIIEVEKNENHFEDGDYYDDENESKKSSLYDDTALWG